MKLYENVIGGIMYDLSMMGFLGGQDGGICWKQLLER